MPQPDMPQAQIRRMRSACRIPKAGKLSHMLKIL